MIGYIIVGVVVFFIGLFLGLITDDPIPLSQDIWYKLINKKDPFKEVMDVSADSLADLYTIKQLEEAFNTIAERNNHTYFTKRAAYHLKDAWAVATMRKSLAFEEKENKNNE